MYLDSAGHRPVVRERTTDTGIPEEGKATLVPSSHRLNRDEKALVHVLEPYIVWAAENEQMVAALSDERIQLEKQRYIYEQHIAGNKRQNLIKKPVWQL